MKNHEKPIRSEAAGCEARPSGASNIQLLELGSVGPLGPLDSRHDMLGATFKLYHQVSKKPLKSHHYIYISI